MHPVYSQTVADLLIKKTSVQVSDTTMFNRITTARPPKKIKIFVTRALNKMGNNHLLSGTTIDKNFNSLQS
ncbi:MAG: hypothetical protein JWQ40_4778 [Segetibacter sp.]|jgi:hypothetical protein|nr:hypothetical protein [Segetibacter sp.]